MPEWPASHFASAIDGRSARRAISPRHFARRSRFCRPVRPAERPSRVRRAAARLLAPPSRRPPHVQRHGDRRSRLVAAVITALGLCHLSRFLRSRPHSVALRLIVRSSSVHPTYCIAAIARLYMVMQVRYMGRRDEARQPRFGSSATSRTYESTRDDGDGRRWSICGARPARSTARTSRIVQPSVSNLCLVFDAYEVMPLPPPTTPTVWRELSTEKRAERTRARSQRSQRKFVYTEAHAPLALGFSGVLNWLVPLTPGMSMPAELSQVPSLRATNPF